MTAAVVVAAVVLIGAAVAVFALQARRKRAAPASAPPADWTHAAGREFAGLSESARCELIFAIAALDDQRSLDVLAEALGDPSEAVVLAAAHTLTSRGCAATVDAYFAAHPDKRNARIAATLALLTPEVPVRASS